MKSSTIRGVYRHGSGWKVDITKRKYRQYVGWYKRLDDAEAAAAKRWRELGLEPGKWKVRKLPRRVYLRDDCVSERYRVICRSGDADEYVGTYSSVFTATRARDWFERYGVKLSDLGAAKGHQVE